MAIADTAGGAELIRIFGTGITSSGTLDVESGLTEVLFASAVWSEAPGADDRWDISISGETVSFTNGSIDKAFYYEIVGLI